jgi:hypothetical protein
MSKPRILLLALLAALPLCGIAGWWATRPTATEAKVKALLERVTPIGTNADRVISVLDSIRVEHSDLSPKSRTIYANFGRPTRGLWVSGSIYVEMHFDESGRLTARDVREILTGL